MKSSLLSIIFLFICSFGYSQIVITEIMYNPPESGQDSLEYIEIHNAGDVTVDISGYFFDPAEGVGDTIGANVLLPAGAYYVFSGNAQAIQGVFGIMSDQWTDGALLNGGEDIILRDASGAMVDIVEYGNLAPWPTVEDGTNGDGASIELCDANADNSNGTNWRASESGTGIMVNGFEVKGTPGADNNVTCTVSIDHVVEVSSNVFTPADLMINVGETVGWTNLGGNHNVNGTQATYPNNPEGFGNGAPSSSNWDYTFTFSQVGVYDYQCDPHVGFGMTGTITVIDPNAPSFPSYDIGTVTTTDADGAADSLFVNCTIQGTVHSPNFRPAGLTFNIIDDNGDGINVFMNSGNAGYTVSVGDELSIEGQIGQFNGLTQIAPATISVLGQKALTDPVAVNTLDESTESQLVKVTGSLDPSSWIGDGTTFNVDLTLSSGEIVTVRVDEDVEPSNLLLLDECNSVEIIGIGGQFDDESPFDSNYQLFPRFADDVDCLTSTNDLAEDGPIALAPNPASQVLNVMTDVEVENFVIINTLGQTMKVGAYQSQINISDLDNGMYYISLIKADRSHTISFVKI